MSDISFIKVMNLWKNYIKHTHTRTHAHTQWTCACKC